MKESRSWLQGGRWGWDFTQPFVCVKAPWGVVLLPALRGSLGVAHGSHGLNLVGSKSSAAWREKVGKGRIDGMGAFFKISKIVRRIWQLFVPLDLVLSEPRIGRRHCAQWRVFTLRRMWGKHYGPQFPALRQSMTDFPCVLHHTSCVLPWSVLQKPHPGSIGSTPVLVYFSLPYCFFLGAFPLSSHTPEPFISALPLQ